VFVGYSLDDPDFRQIWSIVSNRLGRARRMAYSIMVGARASDIARFERRGVKVISLPGAKDRYGETLAGAFQELQDYVRENVIAASQVTEERPLRELQLPRDATNRLCFFSIPLGLLSLYRSRVFPAVEEIGFVPITADDVISPGDNINAKIDALIDRAAVMVVELSSQWTRAEYEIAIARNKVTDERRSHRRDLSIIIVLANDQQVPSSARAFPIICRSSLLTEEADQFVEQLAGTLREIAATMDLDRSQEPRRLLEAREYRAAVISAMTLLETWLRANLNKASWNDARKPASFRNLIDMATSSGLVRLGPAEARRLQDWIKVRNEAVHTAALINRNTAREIVEGVLRMVGAD
jgi:hypothetical protein